jgi:aspartyl-tRNA(Asn)/glutamyl-tRNA(Gln) amidotransferase subunit A
MQPIGQTLNDLARALASGETTSRSLVEGALEAIAHDGRAFTHVDLEGARRAADASDARRERGDLPSPLAGIPVSVKDLFDVAGEPTAAGSFILRHAPPATKDAPVVARLKGAGAIIIGRTQMSEFAFTGLGLNPHWPVLPNPRDEHRAPGGSSSGAAVAVARGQCAVGLGTDTGGSVRIPSAFCGLTGLKPTQQRVTRAGAFPLSPSLDSIGPIANSVACCRTVDALIADAPIDAHPPVSIRGLRFGVLQEFVLGELDAHVSAAFENTLRRLSAAGARIERLHFPEFERLPEINARGALANAEAYEVHRAAGLLAQRKLYDPNVIARIELGGRMSADDVRHIREERSALIRATDERTKGFDALLFPTVATVAPRLSDLAEPQTFAKANALALRNAGLVNFIDRCALSVPMQDEGALPCGLMIVGETMGDARLLAIGEAIEAALATR